MDDDGFGKSSVNGFCYFFDLCDFFPELEASDRLLPAADSVVPSDFTAGELGLDLDCWPSFLWPDLSDRSSWVARSILEYMIFVCLIRCWNVECGVINGPINEVEL